MVDGIIILSQPAKSSLHCAVAEVGVKPVHEVHQDEQILDAERTASIRQRHEDIWLSGVGPRRGQGGLPAVIGEEEHPILPPGATQADEHELQA